MLFILSKSFSASVENGDQDSIDCLRTLLDSRKRGLLLIYSSTIAKDRLARHLKNTGDTHNAQLLEIISKKFRQKRQLLREIEALVIISGPRSGSATKRGRAIIVDAKFANHSNILYPPIFLGENLSDCELYTNRISKGFTAGLPISMTEIQVFDRFEPGGGNSTHMSYQRHKSKGIDLCLCVVDSDRNNPSSNLGDTAKFVVNVDKTNKSPLCTHHVIDTYSAENLLPIDELFRQFQAGKSAEQAKDFEHISSLRSMSSWGHLPLKKGIRGNDLKGESAYAKYWTDQLSKAGRRLPCCNALGCECISVPSISDKTLSNALSADAPRWERNLNTEINPLLRAQLAELAKLIKSWMCIGKPIRS